MSIFSVKLGCLLLTLLLHGCGPFPDLRGLVTGDIDPPLFLGAESVSPRLITLRFNEPVMPIDGSTALTPTIQPKEVDCTDNVVSLSLTADLDPGGEYFVESTVKDRSGNQIRVLAVLYGYNPRTPEIIVNEFITQGSTSHPDMVELLVLTAGNTAGMCIYEGIADNWSDRCILPSNEVNEGDYILIHFKPEGIVDEKNEIGDISLSAGKDASETAWDYWVPDGNGLGGNNGVISVYKNPGGALIDAVIYSNRTSSSDDTYRGFGSRDMMERADALYEAGGWTSEGEAVSPEDAVNPDDSTSTRSINRQNEAVDSNSNLDWHIVPTRGATFGSENLNDVYKKD